MLASHNSMGIEVRRLLGLYFNDYVFAVSLTRFLIPHFILLPLFAFPSAGSVDRVVLPEGMQSVDFSHTSVTGTAEGQGE